LTVTLHPLPASVWQELSLKHQAKLRLPRRLGEQNPPRPQSASTRQLLPVAQMFAVVSEFDERQAQGALLVQSESTMHSS
jgi:hypothetical protein